MSKPKVIACTILFYGEEYLDACIRAVAPFVDAHYILYTNHPTQGYNHHLKSPDADKDMNRIATQASDKVVFVDVSGMAISHEGDHRNIIYRFTDGFDCMVYVDPDEIFEPEDFQKAVDQCMSSGRREHGVKGYYHFWRSFDYCLTDGFRPIRFINLNVPYVASDPKGEVECRIYHFSLCQRAATIEHKFKVFGHANEMRVNYFEEVWKAWMPGNEIQWLHPTSMGIWHRAEPFDKTTLPEVLRNHPNYNRTYNTTW